MLNPDSARNAKSRGSCPKILIHVGCRTPILLNLELTGRAAHNHMFLGRFVNWQLLVQSAGESSFQFCSSSAPGGAQQNKRGERFALPLRLHRVRWAGSLSAARNGRFSSSELT